MFSHVCVKNSVHRGLRIPACIGTEPPGQTAPGQTPPHTPRQTPPHWPLQRTVRIQLECILVILFFLLGSRVRAPQMFCTHVQVCVSNGLSALLATKRSAGVALEVNLKNPWHTGIKTHKGGIHPGFETQGRHLPKSKTGISVAPQKKTGIP